MTDHDAQWRGILTPADRREIWEWIAEEGELPSVFAISGKLDISTCPFAKAIFRALKNPIVRNVVAMAGVQCLKTLIGECWLLWSIVNDPGPTQWLMEDDQTAKDHARGRFIPLMEKFPIVHGYYTGNRFDRSNAFIRFAHATLYLEGAHVRANLQRRSIKNQMRSEVWQADKWTPGTLREASSRTIQFVHNSKTYTESQPGWHQDYGIDDMHGAFLAGNQQVLHFACDGCHKLQPFLWEHTRHDGTRAAMRWDETERTRRENGEWRWAELLPTVRYECIHCGHRHYDDPITRRRLTSTLEFVAQNPDADPITQSFTWNQLALPNLSWFAVGETGGVKNFLLAREQAEKGFDKPMRDFWMKCIAEPYNPAKHSAVAAMETVELSSPSPGGEGRGEGGPITVNKVEFVHRMLTLDVQEDHFWYLVEIWSAKGDSLTLESGRLFTWDEIAEVQKRFGVLDQNVGVDAGHRRYEVFIECARHGHIGRTGGVNRWLCWKAYRGSDQEDFPHVPKLGRDKGKRFLLPYTQEPTWMDPCRTMRPDDPRRNELRGRRVELITWSNPSIKDIAINRRDGRARGLENLVARGSWNDEFNRQMHSQKKKPVAAKYGPDKWKWEKFRDDHLFDCKCMGIVRAFRAGLLAAAGEGESQQ